jgi:sulfatase maturation enzyme AslB (radical SAM superfamily)
MIVSICPTFYCNSRCDYCYLGSLRNSKEVIDINVLKATLDKITDKIDFVDIFGGEISLLPSSYLSELNKLAGTHCGVTTSLEDNRVLSFN